MSEQNLLNTKNLSVNYGNTAALIDVSLDIKPGEFVALFGPNGAGKSTVLRAIFGLSDIAAGEIFWRGRKISPRPDEMAKKGVVFVPQGRRVFPRLTVLENLNLGGVFISNRLELAARVKAALDFFPALAKRKQAKAGTLSGGEQQMLALGRGLVAKPVLILLDEPSLGLAPKVLSEVFEKIKEISQQNGITVMAAEHKIGALAKIAARGYLLDQGKMVASGPILAIINDLNIKTNFRK